MNKKFIFIAIFLVVLIIVGILIWQLRNSKDKGSDYKDNEVLYNATSVEINLGNQTTLVSDEDYRQKCRLGRIDQYSNNKLQSDFCKQKMDEFQIDTKTGLPKLLVANDKFKAFINDAESRNLLPFKKNAAYDWVFGSIPSSEEEAKKSYWLEQGDQTALYKEFESGYSPNKRWALILTDEIETFLDMWDFQTKCVLRVHQGTNYSHISNFVWLNENTLATWGDYSYEEIPDGPEPNGWPGHEFVFINYIGDSVCEDEYFSQIFMIK
jgi:hypothetical protein